MKKNSILAWGSFIGQFTWYHIVFYNFTNSPLRVLTEQTAAANPQTLLLILLLSIGLTIVLSFLFLRDKDMHLNRQVWFLVCTALLICVIVIPFMANLPFLYLLVVLCGAFSGVIFFRNLYAALFYASDNGWLRTLIVSLFIFNIFIHLYALVPKEWNPAFMYSISVIVLGVSLAMGLAYKSNTLEVRKSLPENRLKLKSILPIMVLFAGINVCFAAYKSAVFAIMPETFEIAVYQAIVCAISLAILFAVGKRLKQGAYLIILFALLTAVLISFQILGTGGHMTMETFVQPAYICWNVILFSYMRSLFHQYGKNHLRLRIIISFFLLSVILPEIIAKWLFEEFFSGNLQLFGLLYAVIFGLLLLITQISRNSKDAYQKSEEETSADFFAVPNSVPPLDIHDVLAELLPSSSSAERLTAQETDVLKLLLRRQDIDVIAYMLGIPINAVRTNVKTICEKLGIRSKAELVNIEQSNMMQELLTPDEMDVAIFLLEGETPFGISRKIHRSIAEVNLQLESIRNKIIRKGDPDPVVSAAVALFKLTRREADMLRCIRQNMTNQGIAAELFLSEETVKTHIRSLMKKLPVSNRRELAEWQIPAKD